MILVTGAGGKTGHAVVRSLVGRGAPVRAWVHRPAQARTLGALGATETLVGDMRSGSDAGKATDGVSAVYHICPNVQPDEFEIGQRIVAATRGAGVRRFVYHSVLHPQVEAMAHHWQKLRVEEHLFTADLEFTILQPAAYMQNVLAQRERIIGDGVYAVPYGAETRLGLVDLQDVADAAAAVLTGRGHDGATYELAGPEVLTQTEMAAILSQQLGRPVLAEAVPIAEWVHRAVAAGLSEYAVDCLIRMFRYYEEHGFWGNGKVLGWLLGRKPASFSTFAGRMAIGAADAQG